MTTPIALSGIPLPIVKFNRWILLSGIIVAILFQQPVITTILFFLLLPGVFFGRKASLIFLAGSQLFAEKNRSSSTEDAGLMRFNNSIALMLLGVAQILFLAGATAAGWVFSGIVAVAAAVALSGFCFGCVLYFQFNLQRYKLFGQAKRKCSV